MLSGKKERRFSLNSINENWHSSFVIKKLQSLANASICSGYFFLPADKLLFVGLLKSK